MSTVRKALTFILLGTMLGVFAYGLIRYPDGPIHPCGVGHYCGKQGQPHTREQYLAFERWQTALFYMWAPGMLGLYFLNKKEWDAKAGRGQWGSWRK